MRAVSGKRIFRLGDLDAIRTSRTDGRALAYARVSSRRQQAEGDLDRQVARLRAAGGDGLVVFTDVASGLSDRRAGLRRALTECMSPEVNRLLVEHPDRLARFGCGVIEHLLGGFGVTVVYTGQGDTEAWVESELVADMIAVVTSLAGRLYGQRSARARRLRDVVAAETEGAGVTARRLRQWRGVVPVAAPTGVAVTTRLRTAPAEDRVLDQVAALLGRLRRTDLARVWPPCAAAGRVGRRRPTAGTADPAQPPQERGHRGHVVAVGGHHHPGQRRPVPVGPPGADPACDRVAGRDRHHRKAVGRAHR